MNVQLPSWAQSPLTAHLDWNSATVSVHKFRGARRIILFTKPKKCLLYVSKFDVDSDGPGGSATEDSYWQSDTSLHTSDGQPLNSHQFPGIVVPPTLGVRMSDFGICFWHSAIVPVQAYDFGPRRKIGEGSIYTGRKLGVIAPNVSDHYASTSGNEVNDVVTLLFPRSGPGHAIERDLIPDALRQIAPYFFS